MKRLYKLLISALTIVLISCQYSPREIKIKPNKIGGLFEVIESGVPYKFYNSGELFKLDTSTFIPFNDFIEINRRKSEFEGTFTLGFSLNADGAEQLRKMTEGNIRKQICFVVDDKVIAAPIVMTAITGGQVDMTIADEKAIDDILNYLQN
jgi:preprotein translocase subunit SecD